MTEIDWLPYKIILEQRGFGYWKWEVQTQAGGYVANGSASTKRAALRRARRYRKAEVPLAA